MRDSSRDLAAFAAVVNRMASQMRQACLDQIVATTINLVQDLGFHLSDFLKALADYVQNESSVNPNTEATRITVVSLLETAAIEAEAKGRELP